MFAYDVFYIVSRLLYGGVNYELKLFSLLEISDLQI